MTERTYGKYGVTLDQVRAAIPTMGIPFQTAMAEILLELEEKQAGLLARKAAQSVIQQTIWALQSIDASQRCINRLEALASRLRQHGIPATPRTNSHGGDLTIIVHGPLLDAVQLIRIDHQVSGNPSQWPLAHCDLYPNALPITLISDLAVQ